MPDTKQTKIAAIRSLLTRPEGAGLAEICAVTGWQVHSARAALSTLRKAGASIDRRAGATAGAPATYHLVPQTEPSA